jgi:hypothetical protein
VRFGVVRACAVLLVVALLALVGAAGLVAAGLHGYERLTREQPVAELEFEARGPEQFLATLTYLPGGQTRMFILSGDEWQLDARVLKWHGWANLLGLDAHYRLERVWGHWQDVEKERRSAPSVYPLAPADWFRLWDFAAAHQRWLPFVDAVYGNATYNPMADGARYRVTLSQSGLIARPISAAERTRFP